MSVAPPTLEYPPLSARTPSINVATFTPLYIPVPLMPPSGIEAHHSAAAGTCANVEKGRGRGRSQCERNETVHHAGSERNASVGAHRGIEDWAGRVGPVVKLHVPLRVRYELIVRSVAMNTLLVRRKVEQHFHRRIEFLELNRGGVDVLLRSNAARHATALFHWTLRAVEMEGLNTADRARRIERRARAEGEGRRAG